MPSALGTSSLSESIRGYYEWTWTWLQQIRRHPFNMTITGDRLGSILFLTIDPIPDRCVMNSPFSCNFASGAFPDRTWFMVCFINPLFKQLLLMIGTPPLFCIIEAFCLSIKSGKATEWRNQGKVTENDKWRHGKNACRLYGNFFKIREISARKIQAEIKYIVIWKYLII